jgi:predicted MFS family arabinose efflux permease
MSRRSISFTLAVANAVGFSGTTALPLWLASLPAEGLVSPGLAGVLGSGEILLIALATLAASTLGDRIPSRRLATAAALTALAGDLLSLVPHPAALVLGRLVAGLGAGALLGAVTGFAARGPDAQKTLATMQLGLMIFATGFYLVVPTAARATGGLVIFAGLAVAAAAATACCWTWLPKAEGVIEGRSKATGARASMRFIPAAAIGCLAVALAFVGQSAVWSFIVAIGQAKGFSMQTVGGVLAVCAAINIAGPLAGRLLGERLGLVAPMLVAIGLLGLDAFLVADASGFAAFSVGTVLLVLLPGFALPYAFAFLGRIGDDRYAGAGPAFLMLGSAAGPAIAVGVSRSASLATLGLIAAVIVFSATVLLAFSAVIGRRSTAAPILAGGST